MVVPPHSRGGKQAERTISARPATQARREEILDAARDLFFARGFGLASMRDVAANVGVTQAAIYYHFKSKDEILFEIISSFSSLLESTIRERLEAPGHPLENFKDAIRAHILLTRTHFRDIKIILEDKRVIAAAYAETVKAHETRIYGLYRGRIESLIRQGCFRPAHATVMTFHVLAAINFQFQWFRPGGELALEEVADATVELLTNGMLVAETGTRRPD